MGTPFLDDIINGDCKELIPKLPDNFIDLVITSPPYNVNLGNNKYNKHSYDVYNDNIAYTVYIEWLRGIFAALYPKMKSGGRICINVGDKNNGSIPVHSDIIQFMLKDLEYLLKSTLIWNKSQTSNRAAWGTYISPQNPSFPTPFEYILIFCKDSLQKIGNVDDITITKKEFITNSLALWKFKAEVNMHSKFGHPAMFPLELPKRLIQSLSYKHDVVLDIFAGVGTTCLAAAMLNRHWIGFELSKTYTDIAKTRLNQYLDQERLFE